MFDHTDLANMRETQETHMLDWCVIRSYSAGTANEFGEFDAHVWDESQTVRCGLNMAPGNQSDLTAGGQSNQVEMTVIKYEAVLRLPITIVVKETDQVQITHRFGEPLDVPLTYEIVSPIYRGPSGIRVLLRKVVL